jgi:hypothetical protein
VDLDDLDVGQRELGARFQRAGGDDDTDTVHPGAFFCAALSTPAIRAKVTRARTPMMTADERSPLLLQRIARIAS